MRCCVTIFLADLSCLSSPAAEPIIDVYVSTGDNHFLGSSLPIDSPASIEATFDLFKNVNHARRIYWRGLEEASWVSTMLTRPENCRYYSFWEWLQTLYAGVTPDELAVKAAHARGTRTEVSVLTSAPFRDGWKPYQVKGVPTVLAVSDDVQHLERGFVPEQTADGLRSPDVGRRMRALHVDSRNGQDSQDGVAGPVKTIARAVRLARPGDTIHLAPLRRP